MAQVDALGVPVAAVRLVLAGVLGFTHLGRRGRTLTPTLTGGAGSPGPSRPPGLRSPEGPELSVRPELGHSPTQPRRRQGPRRGRSSSPRPRDAVQTLSPTGPCSPQSKRSLHTPHAPAVLEPAHLLLGPGRLQADAKGLVPLVAWRAGQAVVAGVGVDTAVRPAGCEAHVRDHSALRDQQGGREPGPRPLQAAPQPGEGHPPRPGPRSGCRCPGSPPGKSRRTRSRRGSCCTRLQGSRGWTGSRLQGGRRQRSSRLPTGDTSPRSSTQQRPQRCLRQKHPGPQQVPDGQEAEGQGATPHTHLMGTPT